MGVKPSVKSGAKTRGKVRRSESKPTTRGRADVVPAELKAALARDPAAKAIFDALAPSHRREYAKYVAEAKKAETRMRRAAKAVEMMLAKGSAK